MRKTLPLLAFALLAAPAFAADYTISSLAELRAFIEAAQTQDFAGDTIRLAADIDCGGGRFNTGDPKNPSTFAGTFDGQGHTISNFVHAPTGPGDYGHGIAMFDYAEAGATIRNLTLEGSLPGTYSGAYAAAFVLAAEGPAALQLGNCHFRGAVTNHYASAALVGFASPGAGGLTSVFLTNCTAEADIATTSYFTSGGLVAKGTGVRAADCSFTGRIHALGTIGGLIGEAYDSVFERCSFSGWLDGGPLDVSTEMPKKTDLGCGGLVGYASNAVFRASTAAADIEWDAHSSYLGGDGRADNRAYNFCAVGGAAGLTLGASAFHDCLSAGTLVVPHGYTGGFVGWTAGTELFSNCTAYVEINPVEERDDIIGNGGFAASVASSGALFVDCTAAATGHNIEGGFYNIQHKRSGIAVGHNAFLRCRVEDVPAEYAGFAKVSWNSTFRECTVRGGTGGAGFVYFAGQNPNKPATSEQSSAQISLFEDCAVVGTRVGGGFFATANRDAVPGSTNIFRRCRAGCLYDNTTPYGNGSAGFGFAFGKNTIVEDCAAYGLESGGYDVFGFADDISPGAAVRRSVGAVVSRDFATCGGGFANSVSYDSVLEDCYARYGLRTAASGDYSGYGRHGGFILSTTRGYRSGSYAFDETDDPISRCFTLGAVPAADASRQDCGSFCGSLRNHGSGFACFAGCYRPAESPVADCAGQDDDGVDAFTAAQFASATAATMPGYDFDDVWHAPGGVASSPYLDASVNTNGEFWTLAAMVSGEGRILIDGEAPKDAYPAGAVLTIEAVADDPDLPFTGWVGENIADPSSRVTTYTVKNIGAFGATFGVPIHTVDDWTNTLGRAATDRSAENYVLMADLDFTGIDRDCFHVGDFQGKFFGQGHTISGIVVTNGSTRTTFALFDKASAGAEIRDLTVESRNVPGKDCTVYLAGLANQVESGVLITNCHAKADWRGFYPDDFYDNALPSCQYYGLAATASGADIRIVDCTVEGTLAGMTEACGFVGSADLVGGEIARCAVYADVSAQTNITGGTACGFAGRLTLDGGATVRECFAAGVTAAAGNASGFAGDIAFRDSASSVRDCYSTMEVKAGFTGGSAYHANGIAGSISGYDASAPNLVSNVWFGGSVRGGSENHAFARDVQYAALENCRSVAVAGSPTSGTDGVPALAPAAARQSAAWTGFDFADTWSIVEDATTPYFAWSLTTNGAFRVFADEDPGTTIAHPYDAAPGATAALSAATTDPDLFFCQWEGGAAYTDAAANPSAILADNHRAVRCVWGKAITTRAELEAVADDPAGTYVLGANIDVSDTDWTPIGTSSQPFSGTLYGNGRTITGLRVTGSDDYAGLFRCVKDATLEGIHLEGVSVSGRQYTGALVGDVQGATAIRNCSAEGVVSNSYGYAGLLVGRSYGSGTTFDRCAATGTVVSAATDTGGLVGSVYSSPATFVDCDANVLVTGTGGNNKGGFIGSVRDGSAGAAFVNCTARGDVSASASYLGGFIGYAGKACSFAGCEAEGNVTGSSQLGGFAGGVSGGASSFNTCTAQVAVVASGSQAGGFVGRSGAAGTVFADCSADGAVSSKSSDVGGFVGSASVSNEFARCTAAGTVSATSNAGGFVGSAGGGNSQYVECDALGSVKGTSYRIGGFVGQTTAAGIRYALCRAFGSATSTSYDVGGFAGYVSNSNDIWRCMSAGAVTGTYDAGGFLGYQGGANTAVRECFALGDATATRTGNYDGIAGGFVGYAYAATLLSDSYCLGTVKAATRVAGGFAGKFGNGSIAVARCYAAGVVDCAGTYAGAFVGLLQTAASFADCAVLADGIHAIGSDTAGTTATQDGVAERDTAGMKASVNFDAYHATGLWAQVDGVTQPYLAWSAPSGDLTVYASVGGPVRGEVQGAGDYAPGATATVTAVSDEGFFLAWTGSTPYADPTAPTTTIALDNHRVATVQFGRLIRTADELDAVRNDLAGVYGLGNDIDLAGREWTPIGFDGAKFTGALYGFGHAIVNMVCTNRLSVQRRGLFGWTVGAVLDGITVSGTVKSTSSYTGGLVGCADATTIRDCHADVTVSSTTQYTGGLVGGIGDGTTVSDCSAAGTVASTYRYTGGLAGGCGGGSFAIRDSISTAEVTGGESSAGFIGYVSCTAADLSGCRADGFLSGRGSHVGGFVGSIGGTVSVSNCVARGDVRSAGSNYGGFVGHLNDSSATISDCWSAGAVWGTGGTIGSFVGNHRSGTISDCATSARANGARPFSGNSAATGAALTDQEIALRSSGWPEVEPRWKAATPITTAGQFAAITNGGVYRLAADIDLGGAAWTPLFQSGGFTGELYGGDYAVTNFVVKAGQYAGLFGQIAGGRVADVQAFGKVTGSSSHVGGFAGKIGSGSLVKGCSFVGTVSGSLTQVGGFAGSLSDAPSVVECCAVGTVTKTGSGNGYVGGFVGQQANGGFIADSYARAAVDADGAGYAGGFVGGSTGAKIARTYCAGGVETTSTSYVGAFGGSIGSSVATNSYYDAGATARAAVNSAAYAGVDPVATADMTKQASFPALPFGETWRIDEGEGTPYLKRFYGFAFDSFERWLKYTAGLPASTRPEEIVNGIPAAARYLFDIVPPESVDTNGMPVCQIFIDEHGSPYLQFAERKHPDEWHTVFTILASPDLSDWSAPVEYDVDGNGRCNTGISPDVDHMFFKYKMVIDE